MREPGKVYLINESLPVKLSLECSSVVEVCTVGFVIIYRSAIWTHHWLLRFLLLILTSFSFILLHSAKIFPFSLHVSSSKPASPTLPPSHPFLCLSFLFMSLSVFALVVDSLCPLVAVAAAERDSLPLILSPPCPDLPSDQLWARLSHESRICRALSAERAFFPAEPTSVLLFLLLSFHILPRKGRLATPLPTPLPLPSNSPSLPHHTLQALDFLSSLFSCVIPSLSCLGSENVSNEPFQEVNKT